MMTSRDHVDSSPGTHLREMTLTSISQIAPYSALMMTIAFVVLFVIRYFFLERWVLLKYYKNIYRDLSDRNKRGFLNHHIAAGTKILLLVVAAYPFIDVAFGKANLHSPYSGDSLVTMGDILVVCTQIFVAIYIFELIYRSEISPISILHHIGAILIGQAAIAMSFDLSDQRDTDIEFILCTIWGAFDVVCETISHLSIIFYRVYSTSHRFLFRLFAVASITTALGTLLETAVIMYLFGSLWSRWEIAFKIVTPVLHLAFAATQLHGSRILYKMMRRQQKILRDMEKSSTAVV